MEAIKNIWKNRYTYAQYIAIAATLLNILGIGLIFKENRSDIVMVIGGLSFILGIALTLCSYCLGGLWTAIKAALNIAKWGWIIIPFPYDIATGFATLILAMMALVLAPIIPIRKAMKEHQVQEYIAQQVRK